MEVKGASGIVPDMQMKLVIYKKPYHILDPGDHQSADQHLKQKRTAGVKNMFQYTDQHKTDTGRKKHRDMGVSAVQDFNTAVQETACKKYNGICLNGSK